MPTSSLADLYALDPVEFERLVGTVFTALGYDVHVTKRSGDQGIDLELRRGDERSLAQCKRYRGTVGQPEIRDFYGVVIHENAARGYFVTTGQFSLAASTWAQGKQIALTDGVDLLLALENAGIVPTPRTRSDTGERLTRPTLGALVETALENPETAGRIMIDGAPPDGRSYDEVADYLERFFPGRTDRSNSSKLRGPGSAIRMPPVWEWRASDAVVRFVDEFDALPRTGMESLLEAQKEGISSKDKPSRIPSPEYYEWRNARHPFVLVATAWEKRLPKAIRARFATIIPAHELDWTEFEGPPES